MFIGTIEVYNNRIPLDNQATKIVVFSTVIIRRLQQLTNPIMTGLNVANEAVRQISHEDVVPRSQHLNLD